MDIKAFFEFSFKTSFPKYRSYAYALTKNIADAEDIVLEVCRRLIEKNDKIPTDVNLESYIFRSIKNEFIDTVRKRKLLQPLDPFSNDELADWSSEARVSAESSLDTLVKHLGSLGNDCASMLALVGLGNSYQEISEIEGIPIGTVMSRMSRCRGKLLTFYEEYG